MTDEEKSEYVRRLTTLRYRKSDQMTRTTKEPPINRFIQARPGSRGRPIVPTRAIIRSQRDTTELVTTMTYPWDRRPDETDKGYRAFCIYRDMGADRTFIDVVRELGQTSQSVGGSAIVRWKRDFQWVQRVRAYDEWSEKRMRKLTERNKKEMVERQAKIGQRMTEVAAQSLDPSSGAIQIRPETVADVVRLAETGTRIERLARGESTDNVAHGMRLVLAHPLPPWAPDQVKQLVDESVYDQDTDIVDMEGGSSSDRDTDSGSKTQA